MASSWTQYDAADLTYDNTYASFTVAGSQIFNADATTRSWGVVLDAAHWTGSAGSTWSNTVGFGNWKLSAGKQVNYADGVVVTFDDTAAGFAADISAADVSPASVVFNNSTKDFVVTGTKGIVGSHGAEARHRQGDPQQRQQLHRRYDRGDHGGTLQFNKAAAWNPVLNLGGANIKAGKMIFDYTGESSPAATIGALLNTSYHSGSATHFDTGKFQSSTADANHGLGWMEHRPSR